MSATRPGILVVEDNAALAENIAEILAESDYDAVIVASAEAALEALATRAFRGVVTDLRLPGMSGVDLIVAMRTAGYTPPVVIVTAYADERTVARAEELGALEVLAKPVDFEHLFRIVSEFHTDAPTVLVVEHSAEVADEIARTLRSHQMTPIVAETAEAALAQRSLPRVAVVDAGLPDGTGLTLAQRLFARDPTIRVLLTVQYASQTAELGQTIDNRLPFVEKPVVEKPIDLTGLMNRIEGAATRWPKATPS